MPDLALLNEELTQNVNRRTAIRDEYKDKKVLPKDALAEVEQLTQRSDTLHTLIDAEKQKLYFRELDEEKAYMEEPVYKVPHLSMQDGEEKTLIKQLSQSGWEVKGGKWFAPLGNGKSHEMFPEEVLVGPIPTDDPVTTAYVKQVRQIIQPEYRNAWLKWMRMAARAGEAFAFAQLGQQEQKALSEGSDSAGGFTVPVDIQAQIGGRVAQTSVMSRLASTTTTMRDRWAKPMVSPNSTAATRNIYANDFVAEWVGETPSQTSIDVAFEMFEISIKKLRAYTLLSNDLIADSVGNLISDLIRSGGDAIALKKDEAFIAGAGTALVPTGILSHPQALVLTSSGGMAVDVEGPGSNVIDNTVSDAGSAPLIKSLVYTLPSQYTAGASWLMRRAIQGAIAGLVDANGRPFWNSYLESGFGRPQMQIEGFPVENSEFVGTHGAVSTTPATTPLIFGDISAYQIVDRNQLTVRVLTERFGDTDQTGLFLFVRTGGGLWNYDAIRTGIIAA